MDRVLAWVSLIAGCLIGTFGVLLLAVGFLSLAHGGLVGIALGAGMVLVGFFGGRYGYRIIYSQSG